MEAPMGQTRTIEIDFDVHRAIELERRDFDESPNEVLRRLLDLAPSAPSASVEKGRPSSPGSERSGRPWSGKGVELPHGTELRMEYNGQVFLGRIEDGV